VVSHTWRGTSVAFPRRMTTPVQPIDRNALATATGGSHFRSYFATMAGGDRVLMFNFYGGGWGMRRNMQHSLEPSEGFGY
jgi:hypothetical protein